MSEKVEKIEHVEYEGELYQVFDDQFDWEKAMKYYQSGELIQELQFPTNQSEFFEVPIELQQLLNFYFNSPDLLRAIVDFSFYLQNNSSLANEIKLAIQGIEDNQ